MKKVCVTGYDGKIGKHLLSYGYEPLMGDITNSEEISESIASSNPDVIIHCAAMTNVVECEDNPEKATAINVAGVANIIDTFDGAFIYLSTDHVFSGERFFSMFRWGGWEETDNALPVNMYGMTKYAGEAMARMRIGNTVILRLSKVFDNDDYNKYIKTLRGDTPVEVSDVVVRGFIHKQFVGDAIKFVVDNNLKDDIIHIGGKDLLSYYDFLKLLPDVNISRRKHRVDTLTPRPYWGGLNINKASSLGIHIPTIKESLKLCQ